MLKAFRDSLLDSKSTISLDEEQKEDIREEILITNMNRLRTGLFVILIMELLLVLFFDLPGIRNALPDKQWIYFFYLSLHLFMATLSLAGVIFLHKCISQGLQKATEYYERVVYVLVVLILVPLALISGLDQLTTGQILVFGINILFSGLIILIKPPYQNIIYPIAFVTFVIAMLTFQDRNEILFPNLINGFFFFVCALFLSKFVYDNHYSHLAKNIQLEEANNKLEQLSYYDWLTEIPNRRYLKKQLEEDPLSLNSKNTESSIAIMDIDHFKKVNDTYGHPIGDMILKEMATLINENIRAVDMVVRSGGEEFLILISGVSPEHGEFMIERLRKTIEDHSFNVENHKIKITSSFGISSLRGTTESEFEKSYNLADKALYQAKESGRNKVSVHCKQINN